MREITQSTVDAKRESALSKGSERIFIVARESEKARKFLRRVKGPSWREEKTQKTGESDEA